MPWIREAEGEDLPPGAIIRVMSILPKAMKGVSGMSQAVTFGGSTLTRVQEEAIATAVSVATRCRY